MHALSRTRAIRGRMRWWRTTGILVAASERIPPTWRRLQHPLRASAFSLTLAAILVALMLALRARVSVANIALVFLLPVLAAATLGGLASGVILSVACTVAFDLFFIKPYGTLSVSNGQDVLTLILYLGVGALVAELSGHARARFEEAAKQAATNALLADLSGALLANDLDGLLRTLVARLGETFALRSCMILLPDDGGALRERAVWESSLGAAAHRHASAAALWAATQGKPIHLTVGGGEQTGRDGSDRDGGEETVLFLPFRSGSEEGGQHAAGVLALTRPGNAATSDDELRLLSSFAAQAGIAVERARLVEESAAAAVLRESDRAKSTLLANVSHDLRTPLTTIRGAAESLLQADLAFDEQTRQELLLSIRDESDRLTALVGNLLDLSRIEAGALRLDRHLYDLAEIAGSVIAHMHPRLARHHLRTEFAPDMPLIPVDYALFEQVLVNLLDNAAKFAPAGTTITLSLARAGEQVRMSVRDQGPGIPSAARERVFERFYRAPGPRARRTPGTGLGLAICRAVVAAHGGQIWVEDSGAQGTTVSIALPIAAGAEETGSARARTGA